MPSLVFSLRDLRILRITIRGLVPPQAKNRLGSDGPRKFSARPEAGNQPHSFDHDHGGIIASIPSRPGSFVLSSSADRDGSTRGIEEAEAEGSAGEASMPPFARRSSGSSPSTPPRQQQSSSSSSGGGGTERDDDFNARRSARVSTGRYAADGDTWVEALAVCEVPTKPGDGGAGNGGKKGGGLFRKLKSRSSGSVDQNDGAEAAAGSETRGCDATTEADVAAASQRLTLRPYFQSRNTGQRVWDEPPSGASNIVYASPEARRMAQAQLEEMRSTYAAAAVERRREREESRREMEAAAAESRRMANGGGGKLSTVIPKVFKRSAGAGAGAGGDANSQPTSSLLGNSGSSNRSSRRPRGTLILADEGGSRGIPRSILEESRELARANKSGGDGRHHGRREKSSRRKQYEADLQRAMLMSLDVGGGSVMGAGESRRSSRAAPEPISSSTGLTREEEEQLAMATALSLSEQEARPGSELDRRTPSPSTGSASSSHKRVDGNGQKQPPSSSSTSSSYAKITAGMRPSLSDFARADSRGSSSSGPLRASDFGASDASDSDAEFLDCGGGGKMPAVVDRRGGRGDGGKGSPTGYEVEWLSSSPSKWKKAGYNQWCLD